MLPGGLLYIQRSLQDLTPTPGFDNPNGSYHLKMKRKLLVIVTLGILIIVSVAFMFYQGLLRLNYPSYEQFPIQGIDISHHQGDIDWNELTKDKISFVFIKATEGGDFKDPKFQANWANAKNTNLLVGAYHFYRLCKTGTEQANNFMSTVPKNDKNLPPVIDLELGGNCQTNKTDEQIIQEIQDYINIIKEHYGQAPIIYVTIEFYDKFLQNRFTDYPIWIRDIHSKPELSDKRSWTFWQFANRGHIKGINGYVDFNVFNGDKSKFQELIRKGE
ncbi:glycoside hydrolase family 25 protein [Hymenobacter volaticus]|uniref:Glycoside hydrolase family 25 protein n=1 Tax=Hymenobacter volaticus TaxID=2932254 RepID=A0ABY4G271_9BACT|nr:glycoside hydrolase family 25 protein [Hymenobacter volaticus]UOQ64973.1 glycoside hydrolase family 25 protein [Hymenobacter volaticus]